LPNEINPWVLEANQLLSEMSSQVGPERLSSALNLSNHILKLFVVEDFRSPNDVIDEPNLEMPNVERQDSWFKKHPWMAGSVSAFSLFDGESQPVQAKFFWLNKRSSAFIAGAVHFTRNWEDFDYTRNSTHKVGIDFFFAPDGDSLQIVLSNRGKLRALELSKRLTNTHLEIFKSWADIGSAVDQGQLHATLWDSFRLQSINSKFYVGVADAFSELVESLISQGRNPEESKLFASRLMGRLIFVWFLRKMGLISESVGYFDQVDTDQGSYYKKNLERLFFGVLNTPVATRDKNAALIQDDFTPYLNGGLFAQKPDDWVGERLDFPDSYFVRLYQHFSNFNFTTDESTPEYEQVAIDPEMLGRVFESLLATQLDATGEQARKAKGAFYTPREIVAYMCRESLRDFLTYSEDSDGKYIESVNSVLDKTDQQWTNDSSNSMRDIPAPVRRKILGKLRDLKTIDPACGSGAFPLGMLQTLTKVHLRLESSSDPYEVKLSILQNNIFGSDIEPMAAEISRLRAWLSLIIEAKSKKTIRPLPNLEFNFSVGNSLVRLPAGELFTDYTVEDDLDELRQKYFMESNPSGKIAIRDKYEDLLKTDQNDERSSLLRTFNPFNPEQVADFFDPEIMFGVRSGFDIVIGNPPYVDSGVMAKNFPELRKYCRDAYSTARGNWDLFVPFSERAMELTSESGIATFIIKNSLTGAPYASELRVLLAQNQLLELREYGGVKVFESAAVDTLIFRVRTVADEDFVTTLNKMHDVDTILRSSHVGTSNLRALENWIPLFLPETEALVNSKIVSFPTLENSGFLSNFAATVDDAYKLKPYIYDQVEDEPDSFRFINTGTIDPFETLWGVKETKYLGEKYLNPRVKYSDLEKLNKVRALQARTPKLIVIGMGNAEAFLDVDGKYFSGISTSIVFLEESADPEKLKLAAAVLNSRVARFWFKSNFLSAGMGGLTPTNLLALPFPTFEAGDAELLVKLVDKVSKSGSASSLEEIEAIVANAYGLSDDQRTVIEGF
jgi:hypothetical protein